MNKGLVAIVITTYQCPKHIEGLLKSIAIQNYKNYVVIVADDGSKDETVTCIKDFRGIHNMVLLELEHGERGVARYKAIEKAKEYAPEFILILDSDMLMKRDLLLMAVRTMYQDNSDGLVIKELPYSCYTNFFTKVKLFERGVLNNSSQVDMKHSIEAARFWKMECYEATGGICVSQIAFEEIQPTIRCLEAGGRIEKLMYSGVYHDEKKVTFGGLISKKNYYFEKMNTTIDEEEQGLKKAFMRWYLFRPVYYKWVNVKQYLKHPFLTVGMIAMYLVLTISAAYQVGKHVVSKKYFRKAANL